jgi:hypothetical protein
VDLCGHEVQKIFDKHSSILDEMTHPSGVHDIPQACGIITSVDPLIWSSGVIWTCGTKIFDKHSSILDEMTHPSGVHDIPQACGIITSK